MKVLFDHSQPFALAHGGFQIQIEQTKLALGRLGVEVEPMRWWDGSQSGDLIHYFGRPSAIYIDLAHRKGMKVVMSELLSGLGARPALARALQQVLVRILRRIAPHGLADRMAWESFQLADACLALTPWEAHLMKRIFQAPAEHVHWVPNGVESTFLEAAERTPGPWLVCTATIRKLKRVLELAEAGVRAQRPVWILGKPYGQEDPYAARFLQFAKQNRSLIRYEGPINDRVKLAQIYREARGFVLLSTSESLSLSALEAAACGCPLLLSDLPWARSVFKDGASYCPVASVNRTAMVLRKFYDAAPDLPVPPRPQSWNEIALSLKSLYERLIA